MRYIKIDNPVEQDSVERAESVKERLRPGQNKRWADSAAFNKPILTEGEWCGWLSKVWEKYNNDVMPTP